jgi:hypothetical protein
VDTGSNISIVRPDVLSGSNQELIQPVNSCLRTVTGERAPIHGKGSLQLGIGSLVMPQELWVADIHDQCILGLDFLKAHGCQVNLQREQTPLRIMNLSSQQQVISKGTELACCETINSVVIPNAGIDREISGSVQSAGVIERLPPHLKELYDRSVVGLAEIDCQEAHKLLCEFSDVFSAGSSDLGCTDLVKHRIDTGEAAPIRQPPRRLPLAKREEAERAIQEMLEHGVIEPSASPWSSPIVLVRKKMEVPDFVLTIANSMTSHSRTHTHCLV